MPLDFDIIEPITFDMGQSAPIRAVLQVLGREAIFTWRLSPAAMVQQVALCTWSQSVIMSKADQEGTRLLEAWEICCLGLGRPAWDGRFLCEAHLAHWQPCTSCGTRLGLPLEPWPGLCQECGPRSTRGDASARGSIS